ncbi:MAG: Thiol-disulfide isomerase or thioredoxin [Planctomycetota bacterium]|nr:Thiol-disulfide isomerase or thioredoxin [Planctomycetota bacterium]
MPPRPRLIAAGLAVSAILAGCVPSAPAPAVPPVAAPATSPPVAAPVAPVGGAEPAPIADAGAPLPEVAKVPGEPIGEPIAPRVPAQADLQVHKLDEVIARSEADLKTKPDDRAAQFQLAMSTQVKATSMASAQDRKASIPVFLKSAAAARKLRDGNKDFSRTESNLIAKALYNEACSFAIDGKPDAAMTSLKEAFDAGFSETKTFENDNELDSLRKRPDFAELLKGRGELPTKTRP